MIKVWRHWIVRPGTVLYPAQAALATLVILHFAWSHEAGAPYKVFSENVGLALLLFLPQFWFSFHGLESLLSEKDSRRFPGKILSALGIGILAATPLFWAFPHLFPGIPGAIAAVAISALFLWALRPLARWLLKHKKGAEGMFILGSGEMAGRFYRELVTGKGRGIPDAKPEIGQESVAFLEDNPTREAASSEIIVDYDQLPEMAMRDGVSRIVVAEPNVHTSKALALALLDCKLRGVEVEQAVESYEKFNSKLWLEGIQPDWLIYSGGFKPPRFYLVLKRAFDMAFALGLLVLSAPLLALIALTVAADSSGPVLFRQERVGWRGRRFVLLKFRTMRSDAEQATGPVWAEKDDPRATKTGKFLRKFRLDEFPQLLNVLRGEMSLVGPRPERPCFVQSLGECIPYYGLRHCVKPGITGWAQVLYPYGASVRDAYEKLQYDLYYAKHMSLGLDLTILLNTFQVVLFGRGR